jgi:cytochrome b
MRNKLVYDLPTRVFHWLFAALFLTAFFIAKTIDDDSPIYSLHSLAGLTMGFMVILRVVWGVVGTRHAKFSGFALNPVQLLEYFKGILTGSKRRWAGHNPASSWAALVMMALALGLGVTGYLMTSGPDKETYEDVHELFANGFIVVVILHVAGIVLHTIRHKEIIALSMMDGKKKDVSAEDAIDSSRSAVGVMFLGLVVVFATYLYSNYDGQKRSLNVFGVSLQLGENEEGESNQEQKGEEHEGDAKDERDDD